MNRVWEKSAAQGSGLLVLLAIADNANDAGVAWPGLDTIAKKARCTVRRAQQLLGDLQVLGELEVRVQAGPRGCNVYRVKCFQGGRKDSTRNHFGEGAIQEPQISPTGGEIQSLQISPEPSGTISNRQEPSYPLTPLQGDGEVEGARLEVTGEEGTGGRGQEAEGETRGRGEKSRSGAREARQRAREVFVMVKRLELIKERLEGLAQRKKAAGELTAEERAEKRRLTEQKREIEGKILGQQGDTN